MKSCKWPQYGSIIFYCASLKISFEIIIYFSFYALSNTTQYFLYAITVSSICCYSCFPLVQIRFLASLSFFKYSIVPDINYLLPNNCFALYLYASLFVLSIFLTSLSKFTSMLFCLDRKQHNSSVQFRSIADSMA